MVFAMSDNAFFVLVSVRPELANKKFEKELEGSGMVVASAPVMSIDPEPSAIASLDPAISESHSVFFVSPSAFSVAREALGDERLRELLGEGSGRVPVAVGGGTVDAFREVLEGAPGSGSGARCEGQWNDGHVQAEPRERSGPHLPRYVWPKEGSNSEALMAEPWWDEAARLGMRKILVARGAGGRELFREAMSRRGFEVRVLDIYRRTSLKPDPEAVMAKVDGAGIRNSERSTEDSGDTLGTRAAVLVTSAEIARRWVKVLSEAGAMGDRENAPGESDAARLAARRLMALPHLAPFPPVRRELENGGLGNVVDLDMSSGALAMAVRAYAGSSSRSS